jgi:hypothetical protein
MWRNMSGPLGHARYMRAIFSGVNLTVLPDWRRVGGLRGGARAKVIPNAAIALH